MMQPGMFADAALIHRNWGWYFLLGILLILVGAIAIGYPFLSSVVTVVFFGWLILVSGVAQIITSFQARGWGGFLLHILAGVLEAVVGLLVLKAPADATLVFTMLFAAYLLVGGIFRMVAALVLGFPGAGWVALSGGISALLGLALVIEWPVTGLWFIGTCVGVDLIFHGVSWIAFALGARRLPMAK